MHETKGFVWISSLCFHCWPNITTTHTSLIEMKTGHAQASLLFSRTGGGPLMVFVHALRPAHYRTRGVLFENNRLSTTFSMRAFHLIALVLLTIGSSQLSTRSFRWQHWDVLDEEVLHGWMVVGVACKRILSAAPHLSFSPSCFNESHRKQLLLLILPSASPTACVRVRFVEKLDFPQ